MSLRIPRPILTLVLTAALASPMFFVALGKTPFFEPDEGRNAEVAREMLVTHRWLTPHYEGLPYLDKPSFYFWLVAGSFKLLGENEAAGRLPSALAAIGVVILAAWLAREMFDDRTAVYAGVVLATAPLTIAFARIVIFDMTLTFCVTLAMVCYWRLCESRERLRGTEALMFAAMGLATFVKGPVGFILPLLAIAAFELVRGRFRELRKLPWAWGVPLMLAFILPWFIAVSLRHPDFPRYALWFESVKRFATGSAHRGGGIFYYVPVILGGFFPWSFFLFFAAIARVRRWRSLFDDKHRGALFLVVWAATIIVFFTVSRSKLPGYVLPAMVPVSLLTAALWRGEPGASGAGWARAGFMAMLAIGAGTLIVEELLRTKVIHGKWMAKIPPDIRTHLGPELFATGVILIALGWLGRHRISKTHAASVAGFAIVSLTVPLLLIRWAPALARDASDHSSRRLARTIEESPERNLPLYGFYYFRTGLPFYLKRITPVITNGGGELTSNYIRERYKLCLETKNETALKFCQEAKSALIKPRIWHDSIGSTAMLVLMRNDQVNSLSAIAPTMQLLWTGWDFTVGEIPAAK